MGKYSEIIGSFIRNGSFPLEANYIFPSEAALKDFYSKDENRVTLHKGLLKIVSNNDQLSLYWVIDNNGNLEFTKLLSNITISNLEDRLVDLIEQLREETQNRTEKDNEHDALLESLLEAVEALRATASSIKAIVGTEEDDIVKYLNTLPYSNITELANELSYWKNSSEIRHHNLQSELDQTQVGVGLSGDGSYNADQETYYLLNATSVMNALKTLDHLIHSIKYDFRSSDTVTFSTLLDYEHDSTIITADVNIDPSSDIITKKSGIYSKIESEFEKGVLTIKVNGEVRGLHNIGIPAIVKESYYDKTTESLVFKFALHDEEELEVIIPVTDLITEWEVSNPADKVITLTKSRVVNGADLLSADVKISTDPNNILEKVQGKLYVNGSAENIKYGDSNVKTELDKKVNKATGLKSDYVAADHIDNPYYATDTKEILLNGENFGGGVQSIELKLSDTNYTPETADIYEVKSNTDTQEIQLTFTPLSPLALTVPETVGDIQKGTTAESLKGKPISEILDNILFKTIYPTITDPSASITSSTTIVEAGSSMVTEITPTFNRGVVAVQDGVTANISYVGDKVSSTTFVKVTGGAANTNAGVPSYPSSNDLVISAISEYVPGKYEYRVLVNYSAGPTMRTSKGAALNPMPTTNKGNVTNPHPAGSIYSGYSTVRKVTLPMFIDPANGVLNKQPLKEWAAMTFTAVAMLGTTKANPIIIKSPRKLQSVNSFNAVSGKYDVQQLSNFTLAETSQTVGGKSYTYYQYTWNGGALEAVNMEIKTY